MTPGSAARRIESPLTSDTPPSQAQPAIRGKLPLSIWMIGFMMLLANASYTMIYGIQAVYMRNVLGISSGMIGLIDSIAEGASYAAKLLSGVLSDYFRRRKVIVVLGYAMMAISRPVIAIAPGFMAVFISRFMERVGNGIQATPRDALISDVAPLHKKGASFGLMRSIGIVGSFLGSILCTVLMFLTSDNYQLIFYLATIPILLGVGLLLVAVHEPEQNLHPRDHKPRHPIHFADVPRLGKAFWLLMGIVFVYTLARVSETFLMLHANQNFDLPAKYTPFVMICYNLTYCLSAYPVGRLSDRIGRNSLLILAIGVLILSSFILWSATSLLGVFCGILGWGMQMGTSLSLFMALIADLAPKDLRGTAFGFFYLISAVASVVCGIGAAFLADHFGEANVFLTSGFVAILALLMVLVMHPKRVTNKTPIREGVSS